MITVQTIDSTAAVTRRSPEYCRLSHVKILFWGFEAEFRYSALYHVPKNLIVHARARPCMSWDMSAAILVRELYT
jgi:hypothetical protein